MKLVSLKYSENLGENREWVLNELTLGDKNLIVGRNSAGKTRTLHVLASLARVLTNVHHTLPTSGKYHCQWINSSGSLYTYEYDVENSRIALERLTIDEKIYIQRKGEGYGTIYYEQLDGGTDVRFQSPANEFALAKRRDALQHSYVEPLHLWASELRHFFFGSSFGKEHLAVFAPNMPPIDERDSNQVVGLFRNAVREFGDEFLNSTLRDMQHLGYNLQSIGLGFPNSVDPLLVPAGVNCIRVEENGIRGYVDQLTMSQGMYRVLALLVNINYLLLKKASTCVIIDDIGEGLDFERSCKLISLLRQKAQDSNVQIIMSTNDRFVMNEVPLTEWTVLHRVGSVVHVSNYHNSKEKFDEFKFTGLSNFSFFEMDYLADQGEDL